MADAGVAGSDTDPVAHVTELERLDWRSGTIISASDERVGGQGSEMGFAVRVRC